MDLCDWCSNKNNERGRCMIEPTESVTNCVEFIPKKNKTHKHKWKYRLEEILDKLWIRVKYCECGETIYLWKELLDAMG